MSDPCYPYPGSRWPDSVDAVFQGGPLDGQTLPVPARIAPPLLLGVLLDPAGTVIDIRAGNQLPASYIADGWAEYWLRFRCSVNRGYLHCFNHRHR